MYRIFYESYKNYISKFDKVNETGDFRYIISEPIRLITDIGLYEEQKKECSLLYQKLSDTLFYLSINESEYPKSKAFLWTLESRGIVGKHFGITKDEELKEVAKLINLFLNLAYWDDSAA